MPSRYELAADETVPAAKSIIAKVLAEKYDIKETDIADYLGVAQAAISKYLTEKYSDNLKRRIREIEGEIRGQRDLIDGYIKKIAEGNEEYVNVCICTICGIANDTICAFSHACTKRNASASGGV